MLTLSHLMMNYLPQPVGVTGAVVLSWALDSDKRNVRQESYRIQIKKDAAAVYDSGVIISAQSAGVSVSLLWESITRYTVRVQVSAGGEQSGWLEGQFVTGFQKSSEWRGAFLSAEPEADKEQSYGTLLRTEFTVHGALREAWLVSSAHGLYQCSLNGQRVSQDELCPGWTSYNKRLLYQTWDVTPLLRPGKNALGVMLGAGWYKGMMGYKHTRNNYGTRTAFGGQLILRYADGTEEWICSDESWRGSKGPILFSEIYDGERYDARLEMPGWDCPGFDDSRWDTPEAVSRSLATLVPQHGAPVRAQEALSPVSIFTTPAGDRVVDFGQNMTGWCEITLEHPHAGDVAELEFFEVLDADGNVYTENLRGIHQVLRYVCRGEAQERYHPHFTFQGFQYAKIISFPGTLRAEQLTARAVHSDMALTCDFSCSNPLINQLQHNILWGMKGNFVDIPTDCPQRDERLGWTGDVQAFARTSCQLMNTDAFYRKWLADLSADQTADGAVTHVVPDILTGHMEGDWLLSQSVQGGASGWGDAAVFLPWMLYQAYGDTEILRQQMDSMRSWISFMERHSDGCLFQYGAQFGDWLALDAAPGSYKGATPDAYTCAAYYCCSTGLVGKMLHVLGEEKEAQRYLAHAKALTRQFQQLFFRPDGSLTIQTQTAHVLALAFGLAPEEARPRLAARLAELLAEHDGHLMTGFMGTPYILRALSENGKLDEAYALLMKEDFPSWLYQVRAGATTIWEHWDGRRPDGSMWSPDMNSFNHYAYGAVGEWLYRTVAGLEPDEDTPGYAHFFISPHVGGDFTWVKLAYQSLRGSILSHWKREGNLITLTVRIPANTTADILLPQAESVVDDDGLRFMPEREGLRAHSGSGSYRIRYRLRS